MEPSDIIANVAIIAGALSAAWSLYAGHRLSTKQQIRNERKAELRTLIQLQGKIQVLFFRITNDAAEAVRTYQNYALDKAMNEYKMKEFQQRMPETVGMPDISLINTERLRAYDSYKYTAEELVQLVIEFSGYAENSFAISQHVYIISNFNIEGYQQWLVEKKLPAGNSNIELFVEEELRHKHLQPIFNDLQNEVGKRTIR